MDNPHLMLKISRIFPSSFTSCQFKNLGDVAESAIPITKESSLSRNLSPPKNSSTLPTKTDDKRRAAVSLHHSSTSNGGWFTSSDTETFFSLSSNSGDSFHLRTASTRFKLMKSIDEAGRSSLSSAAGKRPIKTSPDQQHELGSDHISTQLYYNSAAGCRRRKGTRNRRRIKKGGAVIGESYAVEKSSKDPRGDFRASMVEMIVEKQMFAAADLERLLRCFLSLNSPAYHGIIFDVFSEICQTLFTN